MENKDDCDWFHTKNLKLSILEPDSAQEGGTLSLPGGTAGTVERYRANLQPCQKPRCGCGGIYFECHPATVGGVAMPSVAVRRFWLDVHERKAMATPEPPRDADSARLADNIQATLTGQDWERLHAWLAICKLDIIHGASPADLDIGNLPDATGGLMVPFIEVFPWGVYFYFRNDAEIWVADDQFCVQPKCDCKEVLLSFHKLKDTSGVKSTSLKNSPSIRYNYDANTAGEAFPASGTLPPAELLGTLQKRRRDLETMLRLRHLMMQSVYVRSLLRQLPPRALTLASRTSKVGRNEPCPCGSGKKFKHCCLRGG